ncbi:Uncharacterised protein [Mycobacteroides abscessus subsp. abscessus]|nr:Uncharacterised protein [Mycobacteroides abscessus subsp. abscessus]
MLTNTDTPAARRSATRARSAVSDRSAGSASAWTPNRQVSSSASATSRCSSRATSTTSYPNEAYLRAKPPPRPEVGPVISATGRTEFVAAMVGQRTRRAECSHPPYNRYYKLLIQIVRKLPLA